MIVGWELPGSRSTSYDVIAVVYLLCALGTRLRLDPSPAVSTGALIHTILLELGRIDGLTEWKLRGRMCEPWEHSAGSASDLDKGLIRPLWWGPIHKGSMCPKGEIGEGVFYYTPCNWLSCFFRDLITICGLDLNFTYGSLMVGLPPLRWCRNYGQRLKNI